MQTDIPAKVIEILLQKEKQSPKERQETSQARSVVTVSSIDGELKKLYLEHVLDKNYPCGVSGRVKKVFDDKGNLIGAVKIMEENFLVNKNSVVNEAKISALMPGRAGKIFYGCIKNEKGIIKYYVFMPWFDGITLKQYDNQVRDKEIKDINLSIKLPMFRQACQQLKIIHDNNMIHSDVNDNNFIISTKYAEIYLIDFSFSEKTGTSWMSPARDIFRLGISISKLFPDLFLAERNTPNYEIKFNEIITYKELKMDSSFSSPIENLVINLIYQMTFTDEKLRLDINKCIDKIDKIILINDIIKNFQEQLQVISNKDELAESTIKNLETELHKFCIFRNKIYHQAYDWLKLKIYAEINLYKQKSDIEPQKIDIPVASSLAKEWSLRTPVESPQHSSTTATPSL